MGGDAVLKLEDVTFSRDGFALSAGLELTAGQIAAIIGPSGGGKSTLLSLIAGFLTPDHGQIFWHGDRLNELPPGERPVSMLFQDHNLFPHLTAGQNVALGLRPSLRLRADEQVEVDRALAEVGLADLADRKPGQLSGGQMSRVGLARILVQERPLLLLDEAFAALGPALRDEMLGQIRSLAAARGTTVLMVTHQPEDAVAIADCVYLVADGRVQGPYAPARLEQDVPLELAAYLGR